jgi:hypothetical protein
MPSQIFVLGVRAILKPVETTPRARRSGVNARKQQKSASQTKPDPGVRPTGAR